MLAFADIERLVRDSRSTLVAGDPGLEEAVRFYSSSGGNMNPWHTAGMYVHLDGANRLVLEALHFKKLDACVVRVFVETPLNILYARKCFGDIVPCNTLVSEATSILLAEIPTSPQSAAAFDPPGGLGLKGSTALLPVPPPVKIADIPE
jgi:hypothetical protein